MDGERRASGRLAARAASSHQNHEPSGARRTTVHAGNRTRWDRRISYPLGVVRRLSGRGQNALRDARWILRVTIAIGAVGLLAVGFGCSGGEFCAGPPDRGATETRSPAIAPRPEFPDLDPVVGCPAANMSWLQVPLGPSQAHMSPTRPAVEAPPNISVAFRFSTCRTVQVKADRRESDSWKRGEMSMRRILCVPVAPATTDARPG